MPWSDITRAVALCPQKHRDVAGDACETFAAPPGWAAFPGWPLPPDGEFQAELVVVGQGPFDTPSGWKRQSIDPASTENERAERAHELVQKAHLEARFHRLHLLPLMREVFGGDELPWSRIFFAESVFCPRKTGSPLPLETVGQCAQLHLRRVLAQPTVKVILCLGDDAVLAVTGRYRWEPWRALHG